MSDRRPSYPSSWRPEPPPTSCYVTSSTYTYYPIPWHSINRGGVWSRLGPRYSRDSRDYRSYRDNEYYYHRRQSRHTSNSRHHYSESGRDHCDERSRSPYHSRTDSHSSPGSHPSPDPRNRPPQRPLVVVNEPCKDLVTSLPTLAVMTYNVLASCLIQSNRHLYRNEGMEVLEWDYRKGRLLQEMIDSGADIICLQEVQEEHYSSWYYPQLRPYRYQGVYQKRTGSYFDGSAIFFKEDVVQLVEYTTVLYQEYTGTLDRDNVGIVGRFRFSSSDNGGGSEFCVATTHILYNPRAGEVKLAQIAYLLAKLHNMATTRSGDLLPCILCGDFNSLPNSPFLKFLLEGQLDYSRLQATDVAGYNRSPNRKRLIPIPLLPGKLGIGQNCVYRRSISDAVTEDLGRVNLLSKDSGPHEDNDEPRTQSGAIDLTNDRRDGCAEGTTDNSSRSIESKSTQSSGRNLKVPPLEVKRPTDTVQECNPVLTHPFNFGSSYPLPSSGSDGPTITTYHRHASETVDYLLYTPRAEHKVGFRLLSRWALPSRHTLLRLGPQPNDVLSSDHLYLMAKFQLII